MQYENPFNPDTAEHSVFDFLWRRYLKAKITSHQAFNSLMGLFFNSQPLTFNDQVMYDFLVAETKAACAVESVNGVVERVLARYQDRENENA